MLKQVESLTIHEKFAIGEKKFLELEEMDTQEPEYKQTIDDLIVLFLGIFETVEKEGIFSSNERLRDVKDTEVKFLVVGYYLGELFNMSPINLMKEAKKKMKFLQQTKVQFDHFLQRASEYGVLDEEERRIAKNPSQMNRDAKVALFRKKKEIKNEITRLRKKKIDPLDDEYGEWERKVYTKLVKQYSLEIIDNIKYVEQEIQMVKFRLSKTDQELDDLREERLKKQEERLKKEPEILRIDSSFLQKLGVPQSSEDFRKKIQSEMFLRKNQPTVGLDRVAEVEMEKMEVAQKKEEEAEKNKVEFDEDNNDQVNEKMYKDRNWNNWKDEHPKGMGNIHK